MWAVERWQRVRVQEALEHDGGSDGVTQPALAFGAAAGFFQDAVGHGGGEPLVPEDERHCYERLKLGRLAARFYGLMPFDSGKCGGQTGDDAFDLMAARQLRDGSQRRMFEVDRLERRSQRAAGVGDGDADAALAEIQP
jgi:hypothetical protein